MTYTQLMAHFQPRTITSDEQYWVTQKVIDTLIDKPSLSTDEHDYLNLLSLLIEQYDERNETIPELCGIVLIKALIQEMGLKQKDLISIFKYESTVSDVLNGHRKLTVEHIQNLSRLFNLPHGIFFESQVTTSNLHS